MIIHVRLSGLQLFTFPIDSLIEVKSRDISRSITWICKGGKGGRETPDSRKWQLFPLRRRRHINLAEDEVGEEVVTAQSPTPSPRSRELKLLYMVAGLGMLASSMLSNVSEHTCPVVSISGSLLAGVKMGWKGS